MPHDDVLLRMLAANSGFGHQLGDPDGWLCFGAAGNRARLWLKSERGSFVAAAAPADVVAEVGTIDGCELADIPLPDGAVAAWRAATEVALDTIVRRIAVLGYVLPDAPLKRFEEEVEAALAADSADRTTERVQEVRQRVGQDLFRKALMDYWGGQCPITGITEPALLRASHIKPWADSSDAERLDVHNGLLLAAHLDAAFDAGLIAIAEDGRVLVSERLGELERCVLGVEGAVEPLSLSVRHRVFLAWHRERIYKNV